MSIQQNFPSVSFRNGPMFNCVEVMNKQENGCNPTTLVGSRVKLKSTCEACVLSKLKCSKDKPKCKRCMSTNRTCVYLPEKRRGKKRKQNTVNEAAGTKSKKKSQTFLVSDGSPEISTSFHSQESKVTEDKICFASFMLGEIANNLKLNASCAIARIVSLKQREKHLDEKKIGLKFEGFNVCEAEVNDIFQKRFGLSSAEITERLNNSICGNLPLGCGLLSLLICPNSNKLNLEKFMKSQIFKLRHCEKGIEYNSCWIDFNCEKKRVADGAKTVNIVTVVRKGDNIEGEWEEIYIVFDLLPMLMEIFGCGN